jgi:hypothetical protein
MDNGEATMKTLFDEIRDGLQAGFSSDALLDIVRRHKSGGLSQQAAYDALEKLWTEHGCNDCNEGDGSAPACDMLGGLLDRVWGYCPAKDALWETSLSAKK